ncbi:MAG: chromosome segregation protein SMC [Bacillota bacterium]|nr:chromosome segregation protein SMC [Bacillota bacterium]
MYLKSLRMQGFKSFPDQTVIEFHQGITAIVGPNGSGKSNITDAIRWVLGEQSAKTLRGSRMEDVIFSGTETRRQLGFAEVTITFDNKDHHIPLDYETVEVTRRYYRSGDSEYLINKVQCRLKDIRELFLDTGIGRDGYSIIGQGRIDQILSDNSEDRRKVFDEAAGIVKYKMRKREAERKLERTEQNLLRIDDIVRELEQRLDPLAEQAEKAKIYQQLSHEMRSTDIGLSLYDIKRNQSELEKSQQASNDLSLDLNSARELSRKLKTDYQESEKKISLIDQEIETQRLSESSKNADLAEIREKRAIAKERQRSLDLQIDSAKEQQTELKIEERLLDGDLEQKQSRRKSLETEVEQLTKEFTAETEILDKRNHQLIELSSKIVDLNAELQNKRDELFTLQKSTTSFSQEVSFVAEQISLIKNELEQLEVEHKQVYAKYTEQQILHEREKSEFEATSSDLAEARKVVDQIRTELDQLDRKKQSLANEYHNSRYRLNTLQELEASREGFHQAVKSLMRQIELDKDFGQGIHGPLAELIRVPLQYEKAIEIALGAALHNIVTTTKADASRMIEWLKQTKSGRETFLPLDTIRSRYISESDFKQLESLHGFLGIASGVVDFSEEYKDIIGHLLGRVIIADDLEHALQISSALQRKYRIVTLAGDIVQIGGSMTGGENKKQSAGLLRRNREISEYQEKIEILKQNIQDLNQAIENQTQSLLKKGQIQTDLENQYVNQEKHIFQIETSTKQTKHDLEQLTEEIKVKSENLINYQTRTEVVEQKRLQAEENLVRTEQKKHDCEASLKLLQQEQVSENKIIKDLQEQVMQLNISLETKRESLANFSELTEQAEQDFVAQRARQEAVAEQIVNAQNELKKLAEQKAEYEEAYRMLEQELAQLALDIQNKQQERIAIEKRQHSLFTEVELQAEQVSKLQIQLERSGQRTERLEQSIVSSKNHIWENYDITYIELDPEQYPITNLTKSREILKEIKQKIRDLGPVNPNAIEEYDQVFERHDFMLTQKEDIELSKEKLIEVIDELETAMSEQFIENFAQINQNFKEVFSALFVGGEAELDLETDDPLTAGIIIKAQPPGKRLQNMSLLSGGERSLTAIALLLAIFRLRPAPFCVLDEVESALDETNIIRFTEYLRKYTDESQFVLVTHRKGTMEASERLYGITMKERGVSKVLSLGLTDHDTVDDDRYIAI